VTVAFWSSVTGERSSRAGLVLFSSIWTSSRSRNCALEAFSTPQRVVDRALLAAKVATVRDAVARIRAVLPSDRSEFVADRTAREVVILNLFVGLQECVSLAAHWLADEGSVVPQSYREAFLRLGQQGAVPQDLAARLAAASGLRNLVAHRYGALDWTRIYDIAASGLDDLVSFCDSLARRTAE